MAKGVNLIIAHGEQINSQEICKICACSLKVGYGSKIKLFPRLFLLPANTGHTIHANLGISLETNSGDPPFCLTNIFRSN